MLLLPVNVELMTAQHLQACTAVVQLIHVVNTAIFTTCIVVVQSIHVVNTAIFTMFLYGEGSVVIFQEETQYWISIAVPMVLLIWEQIGQAKTQTLIGMNS